MTASEAGVRGLKPTPEMGVWIFTFHKLAVFPWVPKCPSPILYWDSREKVRRHCARLEVPVAHIPSDFTLPYLP